MKIPCHSCEVAGPTLFVWFQNPGAKPPWTLPPTVLVLFTITHHCGVGGTINGEITSGHHGGLMYGVTFSPGSLGFLVLLCMTVLWNWVGWFSTGPSERVIAVLFLKEQPQSSFPNNFSSLSLITLWEPPSLHRAPTLPCAQRSRLCSSPGGSTSIALPLG